MKFDISFSATWGRRLTLQANTKRMENRMFNRSRRDVLRAGAGFGGLLAVSAAPMRLLAAERDEVRVGLIIPLTGATSQFGATMSAAAKVAVDEVNDAGGVDGAPIAALIEDDQSNPEAAVRAARKLIDV